MTAITDPVAVGLVRHYLSVLRGYSRTAEAEGFLANTIQECCVSVEHAEATLKVFDEVCPMPREIRDAAHNIRDRFTAPKPSQEEQWRKEAEADPEWGRNLVSSMMAAIDKKQRKAQFEADLIRIKTEAIKDALYYLSPAGQAYLNEKYGRKVAAKEYTEFWAEILWFYERDYPAQVAAVRAGHEPDFTQPAPRTKSVKPLEFNRPPNAAPPQPEPPPRPPVTADEVAAVKPAAVAKCGTCGGSGMLAGDEYCRDCQLGKDLRKADVHYANAPEAEPEVDPNDSD